MDTALDKLVTFMIHTFCYNSCNTFRKCLFLDFDKILKEL